MEKRGSLHSEPIYLAAKLTKLSGSSRQEGHHFYQITYITRFRRKWAAKVETWNFHITCMYNGGHAVVQWLRHYATNRKVAGSIPDEVNFYIYLIFPVAPGPGVYSASNRNEYQKH
jgi:hypothetical protein